MVAQVGKRIGVFAVVGRNEDHFVAFDEDGVDRTSERSPSTLITTPMTVPEVWEQAVTSNRFSKAVLIC